MIELKNMTKKYDDFTAVKNLDLTIETGEFFGLLGPNGAGKSTAIGMLSTLYLPTEGEILIDGGRLTRKNTELKRKISVVTQEYSMRQEHCEPGIIFLYRNRGSGALPCRTAGSGILLFV